MDESRALFNRAQNQTVATIPGGVPVGSRKFQQPLPQHLQRLKCLGFGHNAVQAGHFPSLECGIPKMKCGIPSLEWDVPKMKCGTSC